jgi:release factor glutamine methyltransferase
MVTSAKELLLAAKALGLPVAEARALIAHSISKSKEWLIAHDADPLSSDDVVRSTALIQRRSSGEPVAYLLGRQAFFGRDFCVCPSVLIPRPDTELLIEEVLRCYPKNEPLSVIDLGTGSGCIAITLALERSSWQVLASDISVAALATAQRNAVILGANNIHFLQSSWWQDMPAQAFDLIVSNPPYIEKRDVHLTQGDLRFEPITALTDQADGLSAYREILSGLPRYSKADSMIFLEHGYDQAFAIADIVRQHQLTVVAQKKDLAQQPRLMIASVNPSNRLQR